MTQFTPKLCHTILLNETWSSWKLSHAPLANDVASERTGMSRHTLYQMVACNGVLLRGDYNICIGIKSSTTLQTQSTKRLKHLRGQGKTNKYCDAGCDGQPCQPKLWTGRKKRQNDHHKTICCKSLAAQFFAQFNTWSLQNLRTTAQEQDKTKITTQCCLRNIGQTPTLRRSC